MELHEMEKQRDSILREIQNLRDMRSGSLSIRYQQCSKSPCVCDDPKHPGHGPIYSFSIIMIMSARGDIVQKTLKQI